MTELRTTFERDAIDLKNKYFVKMNKTREDMENKRKKLIENIEQKKSDAIKELTEHHRDKYKKIKDYYHDKTETNFDTIRG